jgi:antitoxin (DNA-binding transcriptional repressor) of toxin-antitoxin stability system
MQNKDTTTSRSEVTRADALLLFKLINDVAVSEDARRHLAEYVDDILNGAPATDPTNNRPLFLRGFIEGWPRADKHTRRNVGEFLQRVKAGEPVETIIADFRGQLDAGAAAYAERWLTMPEPKDKTSDEWRYWTLRRMERAFEGDDHAAYKGAWAEFTALLKGLMADEDFWHIGNALSLLPHLIIARQQIDERNAREKRSRAGMKGAATRRKGKRG